MRLPIRARRFLSRFFRKLAIAAAGDELPPRQPAGGVVLIFFGRDDELIDCAAVPAGCVVHARSVAGHMRARVTCPRELRSSVHAGIAPNAEDRRHWNETWGFRDDGDGR